MLNRANLAAALALAGLIAVDLATLPERASRTAGAPLFPALAEGTAAAIVVGADRDDALRLERTADGWVLPAHASFPADPWLVTELLGGLERQTEATLVARAPSEPEVFGLGAAAGPTVQVLDADGRRLASYVQGGDLPRGPGASTGLHVARTGESTVYRAPLVPRVSTAPDAWMSTRVLEVPAAAVLGLRLRFAGERELEFRRGADGRWSNPDGEAPQVPLDRLLAALGGLFHSGLADVEDPVAAGLEPAVLEIAAIIAADRGEQERSVAIGGDREDGGSYATSPQWPAPWIVVLSAPMLEDLLIAVQGVVGRATFPSDPAVGPAPTADDGHADDGHGDDGHGDDGEDDGE